jgi:uncharacterized membrane protein
MGDTLVLDVISRWVHVMTAVLLLGGALFQWIVLRPAAVHLPDAEHDRLRELVLGRWRRIVRLGMVLLLLTGFYNYLVVAKPLSSVWKLYHPLMGTKILLAFGVFFLAEALAGKSRAFAGLRRQTATWLPVLILLGVLIVAISGFLKVAGTRVPRDKPAVSWMHHPAAAAANRLSIDSRQQELSLRALRSSAVG